MELLKNKVTFITGGTRGIGFATAKKFLENGAKVILCGSSESSAQTAVSKLKQINKNFEVEGLAPNLSDFNSVEKAIKDVAKKYGKIDILLNNAGISARESIFEYDPKNFDSLMMLNVNSVFYASKAVAEIMKNNGGGCILSTSSMVSIYGQPAGVAYPASKFAVNGITKSLARELAPFNIRVNAVAPGVTNTDMVASLPQEMREGICKTIPLGRIGEPEDIANAFLFLASDMASYISGVVLSVDGCART